MRRVEVRRGDSEIVVVEEEVELVVGGNEAVPGVRSTTWK